MPDKNSNHYNEEFEEIKKRKRLIFRRFSAVLKLCLLLVVVIGIPAYIFFFHHSLLDEFSSIRDIYEFLKDYKKESVLIYLGLQVLQIIICIIPGQALQLAAGYLFHFWLALLLTLTGAALGTIAVYYLARFLGKDAMHMIFGEEKIHAMLEKLDSRNGMLLVFIIFLIPGIPKDLCAYAAGISEIRLKPFLILSLIGRTPGMAGSLLIGRQLQNEGYLSAAIIAGIALVLFILGMVFRKQVTEFFDKVYEKLHTM